MDASQSPRSSKTSISSLTAVHRDFDSQVEAMRGAFEQSMAALREGPRLSMPAQAPEDSQKGMGLATALLAAAAALHRELGPGQAPSPGPSGKNTPVGQQRAFDALTLSRKAEEQGKPEVLGALVSLQKNIEEQQGAQSTLIANLTAQWEQRFVALEQAVNSGLKIATTTAASMNERSGKFLRLGEVLEGALDRIVDDGKDMASLSQSVAKTQRDMERMVQEFHDEKGERRQAVQDLARQAENQVASLRERVDALLEGSSGGSAAAGFAFNPASMRQDSQSLERIQGEVGRLKRELAEEVTERRQLSRELQLAVSDSTQLKEKLDAAQDQILRLSRDLHSTRDEVRQIAGEIARVWSNEITGAGTAAAPSRTAPASSATSPQAPPDSGTSIDAMRRGIANEIVSAVRATEGLQKGRSAEQLPPQTGTSQKRTPILGKAQPQRRPATIPEEDGHGASTHAAPAPTQGLVAGLFGNSFR